ncbi:hypothetical protein V1525DRAFT_431004 [Lipomyces kononenkoae]|uniref:Uncharacterized protein n=1 Tax=Lipomyces kononenkoae TaxID=34357 RepID=A0ACC3T6P1_LIPKO
MVPILQTAAITSHSSFSPSRSTNPNPGPSSAFKPTPVSDESRGTARSPILQSRRRQLNTGNYTDELPADKEIDAIVARISAKHHVRGVIVVDMELGGIVRSSMIDTDGGGVILGKSRSSGGDSEAHVDGSRTSKPLEGNIDEEEGDSDLVAKYAAVCVQFVKAAGEVVNQFFEADDDLKLLRLRTKEHGLMIVPDSRFILAVIHDVHDIK